jgi:hypothetical protein
MIAHRIMGHSLSLTGDPMGGRVHYDRGISLYDPTEHRPLATRFGQDDRVSMLGWRSLVVWMLGYPEAAIADAEQALKDAREIGQEHSIMFALAVGAWPRILCGMHANTEPLLDELIALADEKSAPYMKSLGLMHQGLVLALNGKASEAVQMIASGINASRATRATVQTPLLLAFLASCHASLGRFDDA